MTAPPAGPPVPAPAGPPRSTGARPGDAGEPPPRRRRIRRGCLVFAALAALFLADNARAPADQLSAAALLAAIDGYQATLSPRLGALGVRCRFRPSCSRFTEGAIRKDGALVGTARGAWRILRCGPWTPAGTVDPP